MSDWNEMSHALAHQEELERQEQLEEAQKRLSQDPDYIAWLKAMEKPYEAA